MNAVSGQRPLRPPSLAYLWRLPAPVDWRYGAATRPV